MHAENSAIQSAQPAAAMNLESLVRTLLRSSIKLGFRNRQADLFCIVVARFFVGYERWPWLFTVDSLTQGLAQ